MLWVEQVGNRRSWASLKRNFVVEHEASGQIGEKGH